jgi:putative transposase
LERAVIPNHSRYDRIAATKNAAGEPRIELTATWTLPLAVVAIRRVQQAENKLHRFYLRHVSGATFYKWKAKFGDLDLSDAKRLRALEHENVKLKKLLAETILDNGAEGSDDQKW